MVPQAAVTTDRAGEKTDRAWLVLARAQLRGKCLVELLDCHGSAERIVALSPGKLRACGVPEAARHAILHPDDAAIDREFEWLGRSDHHLIHLQSDAYPGLLRQIDDFPALLYVHGHLDALHLPSLAIVGSRNPTRSGIQNAYNFASHLARSGFCIVSGLAEGIDTAAHEGALAAHARTVAVLGHGIDRVYPGVNHALAHRIVEQGALVSEYPLGSPPRRQHFPERNRLISGSSLGTLVVEAARQSGSLITARLAAEQGREVFAIPGSIHNALARGCHLLIRQGAKLVETADDIVSELAPLAGHVMQNANAPSVPNAKSPPPAERDADYEALLSALGHDPATTDELARRSGLTIDQVSSMLLILELEGEIEALHGGQYGILRSSSRHERERTRRTDVSL
jgi:DNA processing protein